MFPLLLLLLVLPFPSLSLSSSSSSYESQQRARAILPHPISVPFAPSLARVHISELHLSPYKDRHDPFILTGAIQDWPALHKWPISSSASSYLADLFPRAVSDFYPYNMLQQGSHPYLFRFKPGVEDIMKGAKGRFNQRVGDDGKVREWMCPEVDGCKYIHLQLTPEMWTVLESAGDIPVKRHLHLEGDRWWMRRCLKDPAVLEEYHLKTHWKIILIGSIGSGMFNHSDSLMTASWHAHIQGKKWWYVCSPQGQVPQRCYESILEPGEVLYYGAGWFHATRNLDHPSMTITGTVVHQHNYQLIAEKLMSECTESKMGFSFSARLCDALDTCYPLWDQHFKLNNRPNRKSWREFASREEIAKKERVRPEENNYDGRNYIGE